MIGVLIGLVGCLGFEGWALWWREKHQVHTVWEKTISQGIWFLIKRSGRFHVLVQLVIVCLCAVLGLHLAAGIP